MHLLCDYQWDFCRCLFILTPHSQACFEGARCQLLEGERPGGADEQPHKQAVQDVQRVRLRLLQCQRSAHCGQHVQERFRVLNGEYSSWKELHLFSGLYESRPCPLICVEIDENATELPDYY